MKITASENMRTLYLTTENAQDLYKLGRLSKTFPKSHVYPQEGESKQLQVTFEDILEALLK